jgi:hypothetical protein
MNLRPTNFDFWINNDLNVLLRGKHGVGKTAMVVDAFERNGLKYKYFSAATMDPWVDFIGVPKEKTNGDGESYLDLVRPKEFQDDEVEAIFMDEFSRAHKKVRNAVMELIQFKSINGRKFKNLRFVWAAINPDDDDEFSYDVEALDPAQEDRFHVQVEVPYKPDIEWFRNKFGKRLADSAVSWWNELPNKVQTKVTPRRLEYALNVYGVKGNLRHVLPGQSNISKLSRVLSDGPILDRLDELVKDGDSTTAEKFISVENNYRDGLSYIVKDSKLRSFFVPLFEKEKISNLMASDPKIYKFAVKKVEKGDTKFEGIAKQIVQANQNKKLAKKLTKDLHHIIVMVDMSEISATPQPAQFNLGRSEGDYARILKTTQAMVATNTNQRKEQLRVIMDNIPKVLRLEDAVDTVKIIDSVAERSHSYTIASPEVVGVMNHCIRAISVDDGTLRNGNWEEIVTKHGSIMANFIQKMKDANRMPKLYQPGRYGKREDEMVAALVGEDTTSMPPPPPPIPTAKVGDDPNEVITSCWNG